MWSSSLLKLGQMRGLGLLQELEMKRGLGTLLGIGGKGGLDPLDERESRARPLTGAEGEAWTQPLLELVTRGRSPLLERERVCMWMRARVCCTCVREIGRRGRDYFHGDSTSGSLARQATGDVEASVCPPSGGDAWAWVPHRGVTDGGARQ